MDLFGRSQRRIATPTARNPPINGCFLQHFLPLKFCISAGTRPLLRIASCRTCVIVNLPLKFVKNFFLENEILFFYSCILSCMRSAFLFLTAFSRALKCTYARLPLGGGHSPIPWSASANPAATPRSGVPPWPMPPTSAAGGPDCSHSLPSYSRRRRWPPPGRSAPHVCRRIATHSSASPSTAISSRGVVAASRR